MAKTSTVAKLAWVAGAVGIGLYLDDRNHKRCLVNRGMISSDLIKCERKHTMLLIWGGAGLVAAGLDYARGM